MTTNKIINRLALIGALIVILGVGSAASQAFAGTTDGHLNSRPSTALHR